MFITLVVASADLIISLLRLRLSAYYLIIQGSLADVGKSMAKHPRRIAHRSFTIVVEAILSCC